MVCRWHLTAIAVGFALVLSCGLTRADVPAVTIVPQVSGGLLNLQWNAVPDASYKIQSSFSLDAPITWTTEDSVVPTSNGPVRWTAPESLSNQKFYRIALPRPQIFSLEPSIVPTSGGITVYLLGQCLGTNALVRIGGLVIPAATLTPGSVYSFVCPALPEGTYDVDWLEGGQVVATGSKLFSVTAELQPAGFIQQPLGPPDQPPASPVVNAAISAYLGKGGYDYYQAQGARRISAEVLLSTGEVRDQETDLCVKGRGLDFCWVRTYCSRTGRATGMGNNWDFSYNVYVQQDSAGIAVNDGAGRRDVYFAGTNGIYSRNEFFNEGRLSNNVFTLTFPDTGRWEFLAFDGSPLAGKLSRIVDRNGNALTMNYDAAGRLNWVVDTLNRTNNITYTASGKIQSVTDFSGRTVTYQYYTSADTGGGDGDLATATSPPVTGTPTGNDFPTGKTITYTYSRGFANDHENHLLLTITPPNKQLTHTHIYQHNQTDLEFLRCLSVQCGKNPPTMTHAIVQTPSPSNHFAVIRVIMNDALGNVAECYFDSRNRPLTVREFTGRAIPGVTTTDTLNRPTGKLRSTDPDYFEVSRAWNNDSLCVRETHPKTDVWSFGFARDLDPNTSPRHRGDLCVFRELACCDGADTDGDGLPDAAARAWYFKYDPRFGSPAYDCRTTGSGHVRGGIGSPGEDVGRLAAGVSKKGWDGTIKGVIVRGWDPEKKEGIIGDSTGASQRVNKVECISIKQKIVEHAVGEMRTYCVSTVDPRHFVTVASFDSHGNCVESRSDDYFLDPQNKPRQTISYNGFGQVTGVTNAADVNGLRRVDAFTYYSSGPQAGYEFTWTVDTQAPTVSLTTYEYDSRGNMTRCIDPRGFDTLMTYNALDQCVRFQTPTNINSRCISDFIYDSDDNLVQTLLEVRDDTDTKLATKSRAWSYDSLDRCTSFVEQVSPSHFITNKFDYDAGHNLITHYLPEAVNGHDPSNLVSFRYDERGLLLTECRADGSGGTNEISYDGNGNVAVRQHHYINLVAPTFFTYDGFDRCVGVLDGMGNQETRAYDLNDNLVYRRLDGETNDVAGNALNQRLALERYEYDSYDRPTRTRFSFFDIFTELPISDGEITTTYSYSPNNELRSVTDDNGHTTSYSYDTAGRLSMLTDPKTNTLQYFYDPCGNVTNVTQTDRSDLGGAPQVFSRSFVFDSMGRTTRCSDNVGNTTLYSYDSLDNCVRCVDPRTNTTFYAYDYLGRRTIVVADMDRDGLPDYAADVARTFVWDDDSRLVAITDDNTNTTAYAYDSMHRWTLNTRPNGSVARRAYDSRDNVTTNIDANGTVVAYSYDLLNRCVRKDIAPGSGVAATTTLETFAYDGCSRMTVAANNGVAHTFLWDSASDLVRDSDGSLSVSAAYDGVGNRLSLTYPSDTTMSYTYDALDQATSVNRLSAGRLSQLATLAYEGPGRLGRVQRLNTVATRLTWDGLQNPANSPGDAGWRHVSSINHQKAGGGTVVDRKVWTPDQLQNIALQAQASPYFPGGQMETNRFTYDALNRLRTAVTSKGGTSTRNDYLLDGNGNRQVVTNGGVAQFYVMDPTLPPGNFQMDQYSSTPAGMEHYDANGNLIYRLGSSVQLQCVYDYDDRLVEVDDLSTGSAAPIASYAYDALGRRVSKTVYPPAPLLPVTSQYVYDPPRGHDCDDNDPKLLEIRTGGSISRVFCWGGNEYQEGGDNDGVRCPIATFNNSGVPLYYHPDHLGSLLTLTDSQGNPVERVAYDDYGAPTFLSSDGVVLTDTNGLPLAASAQGNPFLFRGMFWDGETRLYANGPYDPAMGRIYHRIRTHIQSDRERFGGSFYTYCGNNPWSAGSGSGDACERKNVIHRDLAARNLLLDYRGIQAREALKGTTKTQGDFNLAHKFSVEIDGVMVGGRYHSVSGLEHETEIVEYKDGEDGTTHVRPGRNKPGKMVVTKDWSNTSEWYKWRQSVINGKVERKSMSVIFHNDAGEEVGRMNFYHCWPTKWKGPALNARNSGHATEKLEISWETMELKPK